MNKFFLRFFLIVLITISFLIIFLIYYGLETKKFNYLIKNKANEVNQHIKLEFQNIASMNKVKNLWYSYYTGEKKRQNIKFVHDLLYIYILQPHRPPPEIIIVRPSCY